MAYKISQFVFQELNMGIELVWRRVQAFFAAKLPVGLKPNSAISCLSLVACSYLSLYLATYLYLLGLCIERWMKKNWRMPSKVWDHVLSFQPQA